MKPLPAKVVVYHYRRHFDEANLVRTTQRSLAIVAAGNPWGGGRGTFIVFSTGTCH